MTASELDARLDTLEVENDSLLGVVEHLVGAVELLAHLAGADVPATEPARPTLRLVRDQTA